LLHGMRAADSPDGTVLHWNLTMVGAQAAPRAVREFEDNDDVRVMLLLQRTSAAGLTLVCMSRCLFSSRLHRITLA